jgi:signal peptidase I
VKRVRFRSALLTGVFVAVLATTWWYLAPTRVGGSTTYVVTHGISMEPLFHTGDLALVRPAGQYKVGEIVAYHSSLLHMVVLHRIVAIHNGHYTFKGDNNNFLDPVHPTRAQLVGRLWVHLPRGGVLLDATHNPVVDAIACGLLGLFVLFGMGEKRRRGRRQRKGATASGRVGPTIMKPQRDNQPGQGINFGAPLTTSVVAAVVFLVVAVVAFTRPAHRPQTVNTQYNQSVSFRYSARVPAGPVYPTGRIQTHDPVFLSIVHLLDFHVAYDFEAGSPSTITGNEEVLLKLMGPDNWSRSLVLVPRTRFAREDTNTDVLLDLRQIQSMMGQIAKLTGSSVDGSFSFALEPVIHVAGTVAGHPVNTTFTPALSFQTAAGELLPIGNSTTAASSSQPNFSPTQAGDVSTPTTGPDTLTVLGASLDITWLRWISIAGLLISLAASLYTYLRKRAEPFQETAHIQCHYGHMIVPIVAGEDLGWPAVDVPTIKGLAKLAESGHRLILHSRSGDIDTYMVNDEGTVYRYQVRPTKVVWGEWSDTATPVRAAA